MLDKVIQKEVAYTTVTQSQGEGESYKEDTRDVVADLQGGYTGRRGRPTQT